MSRLLIVLLMAGTAMGAATYYLDPIAGSNGNNGLSEETAWPDANSTTGAGDNPGWFNNGSNGDVYKLMTGFHGGFLAKTLDGRTFEALAGHSPTVSNIRMANETNCTIRGLVISPSLDTPSKVTVGNKKRGIIDLVSGDSSNLLVDDCTIYTVPDHNVWAIDGWNLSTDWSNLAWNGVRENTVSHNAEITDSSIYNVVYCVTLRTGTEVRTISGNRFEYFHADGLTIGGPTGNLTITNNSFLNCANVDSDGTHSDGIQFGDDSHVFDVTVSNNYFDSYTVDSTLDPNIHEAMQCIFHATGDFNDSLIANNVILTISVHAISCQNSDNLDIINNTLYKSPGRLDGFSPKIRAAGPRGALNGYVANNIAVVENYTDGVDGSIVTNNFASTSYDPNVQFIDWLNHDVNCVSGSDFVDAGTDVNAPATDLLGVSRPQGVADDVGAYEFISGVINYAIGLYE